MARAASVFHYKLRYDDGAVLEVKLWRVPKPVRGSIHSFKYSLYYGQAKHRLVAYDNEVGKGDHRHYGAYEERYTFTTPEQLVKDFLADVNAKRRKPA